MDPLAELNQVKIPKSIGVDNINTIMNETKNRKALDQTVESCVNLVGVNVNTAKRPSAVPFRSWMVLPKTCCCCAAAMRSAHKDCEGSHMGAKGPEQCAGFLRIPHAENPLDNSAVHPESYPIVERMAADLHCSVSDLIANRELRSRISPEKYVTDTVGLPTLTDILQELEKPGRDPRQKIQVFEFDKNVRTIDDVQEGMELPGIVTNITNFGCFVDLGIKEKGLIHVSQLADRFVSDPTTVVSIHQHVRVRVIGVDRERKRIALTMKGM